jgi:hypothetical protein
MPLGPTYAACLWRAEKCQWKNITKFTDVCGHETADLQVNMFCAWTSKSVIAMMQFVVF